MCLCGYVWENEKDRGGDSSTSGNPTFVLFLLFGRKSYIKSKPSTACCHVFSSLGILVFNVYFSWKHESQISWTNYVWHQECWRVKEVLPGCSSSNPAWETENAPNTVKLVSCQDGKLQLELFVNLSWLELYFEIKWRRTCNLPRVRSWMGRVVRATYLIKKIYNFLHPSWQSSSLPHWQTWACVWRHAMAVSGTRDLLCV